MGCVGSKPEESAAMNLCRKRCEYLDEAIHQRYALSEAHLAYFHSLKSLGLSLHLFLDSDILLNLPSNPTNSKQQPDSHSNSGDSHLHFHSDDSDSDESLHLHSGSASPVNRNHIEHIYPNNYTINYMKKQPTPSVLYHTQMNSEPIHLGQAAYFNNNNNNYGEFFGSFRPREEEAPPPPPPPAAPISGWDFLNPFETFETYYPLRTPSRDSREVREEEGIPELEDEDFSQQEVVKQVVVDPPTTDEEIKETTPKQEQPVEYEVHVVDKQVVENQKTKLLFQNDSQVVKEIQTQFDRASDSGNHLANILELGKLPHNRKHVAYQVPSKMLNVFSSSSLALPSTDPATLDADVDLFMKSKNLSSTLHKVYLWEKKLLDEVKIEEKMRLLHEEKKRRLARMDEKGAEPHKIDATRIFVRNLSTKIRIAIQVVDKISGKINSLRDEELWPQLNDFIEGLTSMWRSMLECHRSQCEAIIAAKHIDAIASHKHSSDASLEAMLTLEHELLNWGIRFSCWFQAQKGFVRALNEWLVKCLMYEPEETVDGPVPYSPGRIGAPPIFTICNQWAQAIQRISDREVVDSMRDFATTVLQLWDRDKVEMKQRTVVDKNRERSLDKEDQKIHKELQILDKMIVLSSGNNDNGMSLGQPVYQSETSKNVSLQTCLQRIFESLERFTATSLKAYEELMQRIQEDKLVR